MQPELSPAIPDTVHNALSALEVSTGWRLLFDGTTMNGWRTYQHKKNDSWRIDNGTLHCAGSDLDKSDLRADLITTERFDNFELSVDWKISPKGNSGIIYLVSEEFSASYLSGPEYQLIDDAGYLPELEDWQRTGANYAMNPPVDATTKAAGEWNNSNIVVNNSHVQHWLNGTKVVEYELGSNKWKQDKSTGKWKDASGYGLTKKGHLALQDHGSEAWFRNIKIKVL